MRQFLQKTDFLIRTGTVFLIQMYRVTVSPHMGSCCRFYPSCSVYAQQTIQKHGVIDGIFLTLVRLLKCQPLHPGGIDAV